MVDAILTDPTSRFAVRGVTRNATSERARQLAEQGVDIVVADMDDPESLVAAFQGAYGAYCMTNFWEHFSPEKEIAQAANLAEAADRASLQHVVWSTLEDTRKWIPLHDNRMPTLMEKYKVPHFDAKGEANREFSKRGVPTTFMLTSFYWDNFIDLGAGPQKGPDGSLALNLPLGDSKLPGIARADIGGCAYGIFRRGPELIGKTIGVSGDQLTGKEMAAAFSEALGTHVGFNDVPPEIYRSLDFPGAADLGNMYQFQNDFNEEFCAARDPDASRALNPKLRTFVAWLAENSARIPLQAE